MPDAVVLAIVAILVVLIVALSFVAGVLRARLISRIWGSAFRSISRAIGDSFPGVIPDEKTGNEAQGGLADMFDVMSGRRPAAPKPSRPKGPDPE